MGGRRRGTERSEGTPRHRFLSEVMDWTSRKQKSVKQKSVKHLA